MLNFPLSKILFVDIETASSFSSYNELTFNMKEQWKRKSQRLLPNGEEMSEELATQIFQDKAAIFSEFGRIVCISMGFLHDKERRLRITSIFHEDETTLLKEFQHFCMNNEGFSHFCGHNIKEFDLPYICRRMLIQKVQIPQSLNIRFKKPWEMQHIVDTMDMWKFGDYKHYTSLALLAEVFGIPSPKDDIDGSQVSRVFWENRDIERIRKYCEKDVVTTANVFLCLLGKEIIDRADVEFVSM